MEAGTELVLSEEPEKKSENSGHHSQFSPYGIGDFLSVSTDINDSHTHFPPFLFLWISHLTVLLLHFCSVLYFITIAGDLQHKNITTSVFTHGLSVFYFWLKVLKYLSSSEFSFCLEYIYFLYVSYYYLLLKNDLVSIIIYHQSSIEMNLIKLN